MIKMPLHLLDKLLNVKGFTGDIEHKNFIAAYLTKHYVEGITIHYLYLMDLATFHTFRSLNLGVGVVNLSCVDLLGVSVHYENPFVSRKILLGHSYTIGFLWGSNNQILPTYNNYLSQYISYCDFLQAIYYLKEQNESLLAYYNLTDLPTYKTLVESINNLKNKYPSKASLITPFFP